MMGELPKAIEYHEQHLRISNELQNPTGMAWAYGNIGSIYETVGDYKKVQQIECVCV